MSKSRVENKKKKMEQKKQNEASNVKKENKEVVDKDEKETTVKEEKKVNAKLNEIPDIYEEEEPLPLAKKLKYTLVIVASLAAIFLGVFGYNAFNSRGHMFGGKLNSFDVLEDECAVLNGRYTRLPVNAVECWYAGGKVDENGVRTVTDSGKCLVWLDSSNFISLNVEGEENVALINKMIETTKKCDNGEVEDYEDVVYFEGQLKELSYDDKIAYRQAFDDLMKEWNGIEGLYNRYEITLDPKMTPTILHVTSIIYLALGIIFTIASIVIAIMYNKEKRVVVKTDTK